MTSGPSAKDEKNPEFQVWHLRAHARLDGILRKAWPCKSNATAKKVKALEARMCQHDIEDQVKGERTATVWSVAEKETTRSARQTRAPVVRTPTAIPRYVVGAVCNGIKRSEEGNNQ